MIKAYHIIGLKSIELGRLHCSPPPREMSKIKSGISARFARIQHAGYISARRHLPQFPQTPWDNPGRSFWEDDLAGDDEYVFLSVGPRYEDQLPPEMCFGWAFDAEALIRQGAILGLCDLAANYTDIIGEVVEEVAALLPRLPRIEECELDQFMALMGESDSGIRQAISDGSTNPESELLEAVRTGDTDYPGYTEVLARLMPCLACLHRRMRLMGNRASHRLRQGLCDGQMEILVKGRLNLNLAIGTIEPRKKEAQ